MKVYRKSPPIRNFQSFSTIFGKNANNDIENMPGKLQGHWRKIKGDLTYFIQHGRNGSKQGQYFIGRASKHGIPVSIYKNVKDFYTMRLKLYILNV